MKVTFTRMYDSQIYGLVLILIILRKFFMSEEWKSLTAMYRDYLGKLRHPSGLSSGEFDYETPKVSANGLPGDRLLPYSKLADRLYAVFFG